MLTAEARVETERPSRYLVQLCRHASRMSQRLGHRPRSHLAGDPRAPRELPARVDAEWSDTDGAVTFDPWGQCVAQATPGALILRAQAADQQNLRRIQDVITWNLSRFGRRDHLKVHWHDVLQSGEAEAPSEPPPSGRRQGHRRTTILTTLGVVGIALLVVAHLGLGGAMVAALRWLGWSAVGVVAIPVLVVLAHAAAPAILFGLRRLLGRRGDAGR
ncbi:MAG TPA: DUF2218 domain-containing protein [Amycolatopsis sp.]|uniref:DUF2218 domain-containing protein n=1 Tax=Amycolatopsis sp. TaxID=37632 RepID=UPI002B49A6E7|nr:DUF2218 domain-containing protein [Amycolatopsis sp.]HKS43692.1 DUF2218 domain-containing protein [Amycolatopsis sp.]